MRATIVLIITIALGLQGCSGYNRSYKKLSIVQKRRVLQYDPMAKHNYDKLFLHEIDAASIKADVRKAMYYVVINWEPTDKSVKTKTLAFYSRLNRQLDSFDVRTYLVVPRYQMKAITKQYQKYGYRDKIFVIDKDVYGKYNPKDSKPFIEDLIGRKVFDNDSMGAGSYILFQNMQVVAAGSNYHDLYSILSAEYPTLNFYNE